MRKHVFSRIIMALLFVVLFTGFSAAVIAEETKDKDGKVTTDDGLLLLQSKDGNFKYLLDARVYLDAALYNEDEDVIDLHSGSEARRLRFAIKATLWKYWLTEIDFDFAGNEVDIKDAYIAYAGVENMMFKVGQFRSPFSLEELTTSRYVSFIERGLPNAFPPGRLLGFGVYKWGKNWQVAAGIFNQETGDIDEEEGENSDEGYSVVGRFTIAPLLKGNKVFHVGGSYAYQTTDAFSEKMRFRGYDESKISKIRFLSTGKVKDVDHASLFGLESVLQLGPLHIQGEYMSAAVTRLDGSGQPNYKLSGGYVFASFFVTGDSMPYYVDQGEFGRVKPKKKGGAIELLARYSWVDLNDLESDIEGGEGKNFTVGLTWYMNPNMKIMLNYTRVDHDKYADADGDWDVPENGFDYNVLAMRFMVAF
jgi:phosphate-selective porin OprO and OprP